MEYLSVESMGSASVQRGCHAILRHPRRGFHAKIRFHLSPRTPPASTGLAAAAALLIAGTYALRFPLLHTRTFDPDEFQHLHAAWLVHQGALPYRDFFEHHMPAIQYLLASFMGAVPMSSADDVVGFVFVARMLMWVFAGISVLLTMRIGARIGGWPVAWMSGALLSTSLVFVGRTLEVRPDVPALAFWLGTLLALMHAVDLGARGRTPGRGDGRCRTWFAAGGLSLGCSLLFNQKLLLAGPGLALFAVWYLFAPGTRRGAKLLDLLLFGAATSLPLAALAVFFAWHGAAADLLRGALLNNLGWPRELSASSALAWMLLRDPLFSGIAVAGLLQASIAFVRSPWEHPGRVPMLLATASLLAGLAYTPAPYPQYMLLVLPAGAILGAHFLWTTLARAASAGNAAEQPRLDLAVAIVAGVSVAALGLNVARPFFVHGAAYPLFGLLALAAVWTSVRRDAPAVAAALLLVACSAYSLQQLRWMQGLSNAEAVAQMRFVHKTTSPADTVLDGFTGIAWFRPSAFRVPFFHSGVRARLHSQEVTDVVHLFDACRTRPALVLLDDDLRKLSPLVAPVVARDYQPSPYPSIWMRKEPCVP